MAKHCQKQAQHEQNWSGLINFGGCNSGHVMFSVPTAINVQYIDRPSYIFQSLKFIQNSKVKVLYEHCQSLKGTFKLLFETKHQTLMNVHSCFQSDKKWVTTPSLKTVILYSIIWFHLRMGYDMFWGLMYNALFNMNVYCVKQLIDTRGNQFLSFQPTIVYE